MNHNRIKFFFFSAFLICCFNQMHAQGGCQYPCINLISDPGFENQTVPIPSDYISKHYTDDASKVNSPWCGEVLFGNTFLLVDPYPGLNDYPANLGWHQTVTVEKNTEYCFSFWTRNVKNDPNEPTIVFDINGAQQNISAVIGGVTINGTSIELPYDSDCSAWIQIWGTWNSGSNTTANLGIATKLISGPGNDVGLDNIHFAQNVANCCTTEITGSYGSYCEDDQTTYSLTATPTGGTWKINGVVFNGQITPSVLGSGIDTIVYVEANGCSDEIFVEVTANTINPLIFDPGIVCENQGMVTLSATPDDGTFLESGVEIGNQFDPSNKIGPNQIIYSLTIGSCKGNDTLNIVVEEVPVVMLTTPYTIRCELDAAFNLSVTPPGTGSYSGNGMTGNQFDPIAAGPGIHEIIYTEFTSNCMVSDTVEIEVIGDAVIDQDDMSICPPLNVTLTAQPAGGSFNGNGMIGSQFNPNSVQPGTHQIIYTSPAPCSTSDTIEITVMNPMECCVNSVFEIGWSDDTLTNNDVAYSVKTLRDCKYIVAGASYESSQSSIPTITKLNSNGTVQWHRNYTNTTFIQDWGAFYNIEETHDLGYLVSGWVLTDNSQDFKDFIIMKTDMSGSPIWAWHSSFEAEDYLWDIEETHDSSVIAVGRGILDQELITILLDRNGIHQWTTFYSANLDFANVSTGYSIEEIDDNQDGIAEEGYIITGQQTGADGNGSSIDKPFIFVMQIAPEGTPIKTYYIPGVEGEGRSIKQVKDANNVAIPGQYVVTGYIYKEVLTPHNDVFFLQINMYTGQYQLDMMGTAEDEIGYAIEQKTDSTFVIGGNGEVQSQQEGLLIEISDNSVINWSQVFGDELNDDTIRSIDLTPGKDVIFAGASPRYLNSLSTNEDFYIGRANFFGKTECSREVNLSLTTSTGIAESIEFLYDTINYLGEVNMEDNLVTNYERECEGFLRKKFQQQNITEQIALVNDPAVIVYPQPLKRGAELQLSFNMVEAELVNVQLFNIEGKLLRNEQLKLSKGMNRRSINLSDQAIGIYWIKLSGTKIYHTSKVIIVD